MEHDFSTTHLSLGVVFGLITVAAMIGMVMVSTQADDTSQTVGISNSTPSVSGLAISATQNGTHLSDGIDLSENGATVYVHGTVTDLNGCFEVDKVDGDGVGGDADSSFWEVMFYRDGDGVNDSCSTNGLNCYPVPVSNAELGINGNTCDSAVDTSIDFSFDVSLQYYTDATDTTSNKSSQSWKVGVQVTDDEGTPGNDYRVVEMNTFNALGVESSMDYGTVGLGQESEVKTFNIQNKGNFGGMVPKISQAAGWTCDVGTMGQGRLAFTYDTSAATQGWSAYQKVSNTAAAIYNEPNNPFSGTALAISKATDSGSITNEMYAILKIPDTGVGGSCSSVLSFSATTSAD